jgi:hypothetical protein
MLVDVGFTFKDMPPVGIMLPEVTPQGSVYVIEGPAVSGRVTVRPTAYDGATVTEALVISGTDTGNREDAAARQQQLCVCGHELEFTHRIHRPAVAPRGFDTHDIDSLGSVSALPEKTRSYATALIRMVVQVWQAWQAPDERVPTNAQTPSSPNLKALATSWGVHV